MGRLVFQRGENVFRSLMSCLEVERIRAQIDLVTPDQLTGFPNSHLLKKSVIRPRRKYPLADKVGNINHSALAVCKLQIELVALEHLDARDLVHGGLITDFEPTGKTGRMANYGHRFT